MAGGRILRPVETDDYLAAPAAGCAGIDLGKTEMMPGIVTEDALTEDAIRKTLAGFQVPA